MHAYENIKRMESWLYNFLLRVPKHEFINGNVHKLAIVEEEIDALLDASKIIKENMHHIERISDMKDPRVSAYRTRICQTIQEAEVSETQSDQTDDSDQVLYGFLQEYIIARENDDNKNSSPNEEEEEEELSEEHIAEILKTNRHIQHVISLLRTSNSSGIRQP